MVEVTTTFNVHKFDLNGFWLKSQPKILNRKLIKTIVFLVINKHINRFTQFLKPGPNFEYLLSEVAK